MLRVYNNTARYVDQGGNKVQRCANRNTTKYNVLCNMVYSYFLKYYAFLTILPIFNFMSFVASWGFCNLLGAMAQRHL